MTTMRFFPPVVKHTSIQMLSAIVAQFDIELEQMDVKVAFLHSELEKIYKKQLEGYIQEGKVNKVCLLKKSLYRLKQVSQAVVQTVRLFYD